MYEILVGVTGNNWSTYDSQLVPVFVDSAGLEAQAAPMADLVWLSDYDQTTAGDRRSADKDDSAAAVDKLLASCVFHCY